MAYIRPVGFKTTLNFSFNLHRNCRTNRKLFSTAMIWARSHLISIFCSHSEYNLAQQFIELRRRYFFNVPELYTFLWRKGFSRLTSPSDFALVFLSLLIYEVIINLSRRANLGTSSSILFLQKATRLLPSTVKYYRSCLWLYERCSFTVVPLSDWLDANFVRNLRGSFCVQISVCMK